MMMNYDQISKFNICYVPIYKIFKLMRAYYEQDDSVRGSPQQSEEKQGQSRYTHQAANSNNIYGIPQL